MWSIDQIIEDLQDLGLSEGGHVLVHTSLRAIGQLDGGAQGLVDAFRSVLGKEGTLVVPTFTAGVGDPAEWRNPPETREALAQARQAAPIFDQNVTPAEQNIMGIFPEIVRQQPDAHRSNHPSVSFAAIGGKAEFLTQNSPFHYPLGSESVLARLHRLDGWVLLLGVGHNVNSSLHLAEIWADVPYIHRNARIKTGPNSWTVMQGSPECSEGFVKIEMVLRQSRLLRRGYVGNAQSQLMRQRELISMAVTMLQGSAESLLCDNSACPYCTLARRFTANQTTYIPE